MKNSKRLLCLGVGTMLGVVTLLGVIAFGQQWALKATPTSKSYVFDQSHAPRIDDFLADANDAILSYRASTDASAKTYIAVEGSGFGTDYQTISLGGSNYLSGASVESGLTQFEVNFAIQGISSITYSVSGTPGDEKTWGTPCFYLQATSSDGTVLATTSTLGSNITLAVSGGPSTSAKIYFYNYTSFAMTSLAFAYTC